MGFPASHRSARYATCALHHLVNDKAFAGRLDVKERVNLAAWLGQINGRDMSRNNWRWFRVFVNLALVSTLRMPADEVKPTIQKDLEVLDTYTSRMGGRAIVCGMERGNRSTTTREALLFSYRSFPMSDSLEGYLTVRGQRDTRLRRESLPTASGGAAILFGRSLTYRFAFAAFWPAVTAVDVQLNVPLDQPGVVEGLLLRHLRWWAQKPDIFNTDGTLNIGYTYPNMFSSEDHNSPQSVYWCLKAFVAAGIPGDHPLWTSEELPHPLRHGSKASTSIPPIVSMLRAPRRILCNTPEHHFLLSSEQSTTRNHKAREAKYCKFAYSSAFAFSVPVGPLLDQTAPDSMLCLSIGGGESWKARWEPFGVA